ncbi:MAG: hypothetical protein RLZZ347_710 [Candidatus Parcubacteria bacterium]|jgi:hypothetical protein
MYDPYIESINQLLSIELVQNVLSVLQMTWVIWLPLTLALIFWSLFTKYTRTKFIAETKHVLLEVKVPKDMFKSPLAMELFLNALHQTGGESTWYDRQVLGKVRAWFSLEIASFGGELHFFIWTREGLRPIVEAQLYSQYPGIEIQPAEDYAKKVDYSPKTHSLWGADFVLTKPDPFPIKTYTDFGLDKDPKEEYKIDPITPQLEFLGALKPDNQIWIQFVVRAHKKEPGEKDDPLIKMSEKEIKGIIEKATIKKDDEEKTAVSQKLSKVQQEVITAIERHMAKHNFDVGIRVIYLAPNASFSGGLVPGIIGSFKQYGSANMNGFKPNGWLTDFNYPWQDYKERRKNKVRAEVLDAYRRRSFFWPPYNFNKHIHLSTEELATIYHFPGQVSNTPSFNRILSKKSEAPANLPI